MDVGEAAPEPKGAKIKSESRVQWLQSRCYSPERPVVDGAVHTPLFISCHSDVPSVP